MTQQTSSEFGFLHGTKVIRSRDVLFEEDEVCSLSDPPDLMHFLSTAGSVQEAPYEITQSMRNALLELDAENENSIGTLIYSIMDLMFHRLFKILLDLQKPCLPSFFQSRRRPQQLLHLRRTALSKRGTRT